VTASISPLWPTPDPADVAAAEAAVRAVLRTQYGSAVPLLVLVKSVAGGGKSTLLVEGARRGVADLGERVAVAANTDHQSFLLTRRLIVAGVPTVLFVTEDKAVPGDVVGTPTTTLHVCRSEAELRALLNAATARVAANLPDVFAIVANTAKWRSVPGAAAPYRPAMRPVAPLLLIDECYQTHDEMAQQVMSVGERWVAVGDPGQIDPPTPADTSEWEHRPDGPHRPFPEAQIARTAPGSPGLVILELPYTRRNPADGLPFIQPFYEQPVRSLVPSGSRRLVLDSPGPTSLPIDTVIDAMAAGQSVTGAVLPPQATGGQADAGLAQAIASLARRLLDRSAQVLVDPRAGFTKLRERDIMVIATHHDQIAQLAPLLPPGVQLGTADSLQGEDAPVVLAWHPLSGVGEPDSFHCDAGRTCVMITRHTVACVIFMRRGIAEMLDDQQPSDLLVPSNPRTTVRRAWHAQQQLLAQMDAAGRLHQMPEP
jgi:hypothetical protein